MISSSITDGISLGPGRSVVAIQPYDSDASEVEFESIVLIVADGEVRSTLKPPFVVSSIVESTTGEILMLGRLGHVALLTNDAFDEERISGPDALGFLTDIRAIGQAIYATGMRRQVYVRKGSSWTRADVGVRDESNSVEHVTGFRSIDGPSSQDIYAVGLDGEIWNCLAGVWQAVQSPTNVILEQVRLGGQGEVYAAGQAGVLLRGVRHAWSVIEQLQTEEDFWGLEWFNGALYVATGAEVFRLLPSESQLARVETGGASFARLRAGHAALWSFGPDDVRWTADGRTWHHVAIPKAHRLP